MEDNEKKKISWQNIKCKYILTQIFDNLKLIRLLNIIKYNKRLQNLYEKNIIDYKNEYYKIEIELIPSNKTYYHDKIINIYEESCHIYFDDNTEEIERNYVKTEDKISKIKVVLNLETDSLSELFLDCSIIKKIKFIEFNNKNIKNMKSMFQNCKELIEIDISKLKTDNTTDMSGMFFNCSNLQELDLTNFNTTNTIDMSGMFMWMK